MRLRGVVLVVMSALAAGCSASTPVLETEQTVQPAPLVTVAAATVPQSTVPSTTVFKPAPTAGSTAVPVTSFPAKSEDQLKIEFVVSEYHRLEIEQRMTKKSDVVAFDELAIDPQRASLARSLDELQSGSTYRKPGTIAKFVVVDVRRRGDEFDAFVCAQNNTQVWESKNTSDLSDDQMIDGSIGSHRYRYLLKKRGEAWVIYTSEELELAGCSPYF